jgi:pyruvate/2-oxoglutarate dehydrogenase complex dihydrolipoamide dehydrogenase (E3) component
VACEMAHAWRALGTTEVIILSRNKRILNKYEPFVGDRLAQAFKQRGISIHNNANVSEVERVNRTSKQGNGSTVQIMLDDGNIITAEELLVAVGRKPNTDKLGLETVGLKPGDWPDVDDTCLVNGVDSGNEWLYAIGDINHRALLTHIGKYQARACSTAIVARARRETRSISNNNYQHDNSGRDSANSSNRNDAINTGFDPSTIWLATSDHRAIPQVLFTDPQIASVGLTEESARSLKINVRTVDCEMGTLPGAQLHTDGYEGQAKIVADEDRHVMVGATFVGPQVGDLLHAATIAIVGQVSLELLWHAIPSFPTVNEVWINLLENYGF